MIAPSAPLAYFGLKPVSELAKEIGREPKTLRNWIAAGIMHAVREDGLWLSTPEEARRAAESRKPVGRPRKAQQVRAEEETQVAS